MTAFKPHGEFHIYAEGHVLICEVKGPFNLEFTRAYCKAVAPIARTVALGGPWAGLTVYRNSALFPLESAEMLRENAIAGAGVQMIANCWVVAPDVEGHGIVNKQASDIYAGVCAFEIFEQIADARAWLQQQLQQYNKQTSQA
jgi:hypothetical protein